VDVAGFDAENIAGKIKGADLAATIAEQLAGARSAADDLVDIFGRVFLREDLGAALVTTLPKSASDKSGKSTLLLFSALACDTDGRFVRSTAICHVCWSAGQFNRQAALGAATAHVSMVSISSCQMPLRAPYHRSDQ
jgi:hypothetical protein